MSRFSKASLAFTSLLFAALAWAAPASAQNAAVTRIVVPFAPGGPADVVARLVAEKLAPQLGGSVIIENRLGANGGIAARQVATAEPDGTTLLFATSGMLTISQALYKNLSYDTLADFAPVSRAVVNGTALVVSAKMPVNNVKELIAYGKAQGQPVTLGSAGIGNITHLYVELLREATKMDITHVPYKGIAPAMTDAIAGQIVGVFADFPLSLPQIQAGTVKALGIVGNERSDAAPSIPTITEQGYPGVDGASWFGFLAPAKTPPATVKRLADAIAKSLNEPDVKRKLLAGGSAPSPTSPEDMKQLIQSEQKRWGEIISKNKITAE
jgi:tripartite-type tricarboxylate transporter receptor subunit TctC